MSFACLPGSAPQLLQSDIEKAEDTLRGKLGPLMDENRELERKKSAMQVKVEGLASEIVAMRVSGPTLCWRPLIQNAQAGFDRRC